MFFTNSPVVSRFQDVHDALRDPETFSSEIDLKLGNVRPMIPQQLDPPAQTRYRKLLDPLFSRKKMAELVPAIRSHAKALIDEVAEKGECEFDSAFAIPLPCTAFLSLFGLPLSELPTFLEMKDGIIRPHKFLPPGSTDLGEGGGDPGHHQPADVRLLRRRDRAAPRESEARTCSAISSPRRSTARSSSTTRSSTSAT